MKLYYRIQLFFGPQVAFTDTRQKFCAPCLFHFTIHRLRENLQNPFSLGSPYIHCAKGEQNLVL